MYSTSALLKSFSNVIASGCFGNSTSFQFEKVLSGFGDCHRQLEIAVMMNCYRQVLKFRKLTEFQPGIQKMIFHRYYLCAQLDFINQVLTE